MCVKYSAHLRSQRDDTAAVAKTASFEGPSAGVHSESSGEGTDYSTNPQRENLPQRL